MAYNPKSLQNLRHFKKGNKASPGRPKLLANVIAEMPADAKERIYATLHYAIKQPNHKALEKFLSEKQEELGEYGFVLERASKELLGKYGWSAMMDIFDRLFGRPNMSIQSDLSLQMTDPPIIVFSKEKSEGTEE